MKTTKRIRPTRYNKGSSKKFTMVYISKTRDFDDKKILEINFWIGGQGFRLEPIENDPEGLEHAKFQARMLRIALKNLEKEAVIKYKIKRK